MSELRSYSTRATITPTSFVNVYNWGDFKGNPTEWMKRYFDAFFYTANWGTRRLTLRVPASLFDEEHLDFYTGYESFVHHRSGEHFILDFCFNDEEGGKWVDGEGWLQSIVGIRSELMRSDYRALYLGWLLALQEGDIDEDEEEPPVPAGMKDLSESLKSLAEFFCIAPDLVAVAAENSPDIKSQEPSDEAILSWLERMPINEKNGLIVDIIKGRRPHLSMELRSRIIADMGCKESADEKSRRTAGEIIKRAQEFTEKRKRQGKERKACERAKREKKEALARKEYLESLRDEEGKIWERVEELVRTRQPKRYDEAVTLLVDLRDLAIMKDRRVVVVPVEVVPQDDSAEGFADFEIIDPDEGSTRAVAPDRTEEQFSTVDDRARVLVPAPATVLHEGGKRGSGRVGVHIGSLGRARHEGQVSRRRPWVQYCGERDTSENLGQDRRSRWISPWAARPGPDPPTTLRRHHGRTGPGSRPGSWRTRRRGRRGR